MPLRYNYEPFRRKCYNLQYSVVVVSFARTKHFSLYLLKCLGVHCTCIAIIQYQGKCKHTMLLQSDTIPVWCIFKLLIFSCSVTQNEKVLPCFFFTLSALDYHIKTIAHTYGSRVETPHFPSLMAPSINAVAWQPKKGTSSSEEFFRLIMRMCRITLETCLKHLH